MTDKEKIRAEIERRMEKHWDKLPNADSPEDDWTHNELCELGAYKELEHLETFIDSLPEENKRTLFEEIAYPDSFEEFIVGLNPPPKIPEMKDPSCPNEEGVRALRTTIDFLKRKKKWLDKDYDVIGMLTNLLAFNERLLKQSSCPKESDDLDKLIKEVQKYYSDNFDYITSDQPTLSILTNIARYFTEWQKRKMMERAVGVEVVGEKRDLRLIDSTQRCLFDARRGDWLKVIILPNE